MSAAVVGFVMTALAILVPAGAAQAVGPCTFSPGGNWFAVTCWGSATPLAYEYEQYAVPTNPSRGGASFAIWGGLEDPRGNAVLQNVLNWDGSSWSVYPEYYYGTCGASCDPQGTHIAVSQGDTIKSTLRATACYSGGQCTWVETVTDANNGRSSSQTIGSRVPFSMLLGGVLEVRSVSGCAELPANGHAVFRDIAVKNIYGTALIPAFGQSTPDPQCGMHITSSATAADFLWTP